MRAGAWFSYISLFCFSSSLLFCFLFFLLTVQVAKENWAPLHKSMNILWMFFFFFFPHVVSMARGQKDKLRCTIIRLFCLFLLVFDLWSLSEIGWHIYSNHSSFSVLLCFLPCISQSKIWEWFFKYIKDEMQGLTCCEPAGTAKSCWHVYHCYSLIKDIL